MADVKPPRHANNPDLLATMSLVWVASSESARPFPERRAALTRASLEIFATLSGSCASPQATE
ncbi:hypothetical protein ColTof4_00596 [Colletotrichum tofieldiae]|nr:hypothetical protein ColTof3_07802 [Colletotrichum tofieldiae]GKT68173.1 hypothetical protein ColTof4_00596 [Colletotrichum tofieldiae]GKT90829.1 hypothetical protein Ct61P_08679 [Colletotrichum tofieldiae]